MTRFLTLRRAAATGLIVGLAMILSACLMLPGKFAAVLDLRKDGHFTYTYKGEIMVLGLSNLAKMVAAPKPVPPFEAMPCMKEGSETERPCSKKELADQKADWDADQAAKAAKEKQEMEMLRKVFGGIDPNDPKAAADLAARLTGQAGFNSVTYKGNGVYLVDYSISGQLAYDYSFPTVERMSYVTPFIVLNRRANGEVRIDSPLMQQAAMAMPGGNAAQLFSAMEMAKKGNAVGDAGDFPVVDGHFTLITDGVILSNNTEHGPKVVANGKQLDWDINFHTAISPMALVGLAR
jgi:hypothetical protein